MKLPEYNSKGKALPDISCRNNHIYSSSILPGARIVRDTIAHCPNCGGDLEAAIRPCCKKNAPRLRRREVIVKNDRPQVSFWERVAEQNQKKRAASAESAKETAVA